MKRKLTPREKGLTATHGNYSQSDADLKDTVGCHGKVVAVVFS